MPKIKWNLNFKLQFLVRCSVFEISGPGLELLKSIVRVKYHYSDRNSVGVLLIRLKCIPVISCYYIWSFTKKYFSFSQKQPVRIDLRKLVQYLVYQFQARFVSAAKYVTDTGALHPDSIRKFGSR